MQNSVEMGYDPLRTVLPEVASHSLIYPELMAMGAGVILALNSPPVTVARLIFLTIFANHFSFASDA